MKSPSSAADATGLSSAPPNFADDEEDDEEASSNSGSVGKRTADHHHQQQQQQHHNNNNNNNYNSNQASGQSWALAAAGVREEAAAVAQGMNVVQNLQQQQHNHPNTHGVPSVDNHLHLHASVVGGFGILSQEENSFTESLIPGLIFLFALGGGGGMGAGEIKNHLLKSCGEQEVEA
ncbi:unnamed protein product [Sphagnum balticum]